MAGRGDLIPAPARRPAAISLINAAPTPDDGGERWETGFTFSPDSCGAAGVSDPCNVAARNIPARPGNEEGEPFIVWAGDKCSSIGFEAQDYAERARRLLEGCQSSQVALELWGGALAIAAGWPNRFLADSSADTLTNGQADPVDALACLEQALGRCGCGRQGMIHATPQLVTYWVAARVVSREGGQLTTALGTIVVSDGGYPGYGPGGPDDDDSVWAYATGLVSVRLGPVAVVPGDFTDAVDQTDNTVEYYAERPASATWDGCCHFAVETDLDPCLVGGVS